MAILLQQGTPPSPSVLTASGVSAPIAINSVEYLAVDVSVTAVSGTTPSMLLYIERQGADGNWYPIWTSSAITAVGLTSTSIGSGMTIPAALGSTIRLRWAITGTTPSFTLTASLVGTS